MANDTFGSFVAPPEGIKVVKVERAITSKFVSDGVYKYVYMDTGEDVNLNQSEGD